MNRRLGKMRMNYQYEQILNSDKHNSCCNRFDTFITLRDGICMGEFLLQQVVVGSVHVAPGHGI